MNSKFLKLLSMIPLVSACVAHAEIPKAGDVAPAISLPDQSGKVQTLTAYRGKWVVLYFYPKDDTPGCTEQACNFRDDIVALNMLGAQILGVSVDDTQSHTAFASKYKLPFPLLADADGKVAKSYGAISDFFIMKFAKRYTFIIDPQGNIAKTYLNVDTSRHSSEIIADLQKLSRK